MTDEKKKEESYLSNEDMLIKAVINALKDLGIVDQKTNVSARLMEEADKREQELTGSKQDQSKDKGDIPSNVPNYRVAIEDSPRVCGNCRFFNSEGGLEGTCEAYDFTAKANHVCDAWQAQPVQQDSSKKIKANIIRHDGSPKEIEGQVMASITRLDPEGSQVGYVALEENYTQFEGDESENAVFRAANKNLLPGDLAYSDSFRSLVEVMSIGQEGHIRTYMVKLIDANGISTGIGQTVANDLQPRSNKAIKSDESQTNDLIEITRSIYGKLANIVEDHKSIENGDVQRAIEDGENVNKDTLLSNQETLNPIRNEMLGYYQTDTFKGIKTGKKRKYFRAFQTALSAVGAARQILFDGHKTILSMKEMGEDRGSMASVLVKSQEDAYDRVKFAKEQLEDALTLPSAMHGDPAPGI